MRPLLALLFPLLALGAQDHPIGADGALPATMTTGSGWKAARVVADDPYVLAFDGVADGGNGVAMVRDDLLAGGKWLVSFRARYATDHPGIGGGGKPDGAHFPGWRLDLGHGLALVDSYIWNGLLLEGAGTDLQRVEGCRAPEVWHEWLVACNGARLQVWIDGVACYDVKLTGERKAEPVIRWLPMHERFWLSDVRVAPWRELSGPPPRVRTPDRPEWHDFTDGRLPPGWKANGPWAVVPDPENPANRVLSITSDREYSTIRSASDAYEDYRLTYRSRYATPWKPFPQNDNLHYPHGKVLLRGDHLALMDSMIWSNCMLEGAVRDAVIQGRQSQAERWQQVEIVVAAGGLTATIDGRDQARASCTDIPTGPIGFTGMAGTWWFDDVRLVLHPRAAAWETFADGIGGEWKTHDGWSVASESGNRAAVSSGSGWLAQAVPLKELMVSAAVRIGDGGLDLVVGGQQDGAWFGLRQRGEVLEYGQMRGGTWMRSASASAAVPVDGSWHSLRVDQGAGHVRVLIDGAEALAGSFPGADAGSSPGVIAFQGSGLRIDDVLVQSPPKPLVAIEPLEDSGVFLPEEAQGVRCMIQNTDIAPMDLGADTVVTDRDGKEVGTDAWRDRIPAGARRDRIPLRVQLPAPGMYESTTRVRLGGEEVGKLVRPLLLLPALPSRSAAYRGKFGMVGDLNTTATRKLGAAWIRDGAPFGGMSKKGDGFDFTGADAAAQTLKAWGVQGNSLYMGNAGHTAEGIADAAQHFAAAAEHFRGRHDLGYTVWNEPNHGAFWRGSPISGIDYGAVLIAASRAAKKMDPGAEILAPGTSGPCTTFLDDMGKVDGWRYLDVLTYHPYGYPTPPDIRLPQAVDEVNAHADSWFSWVDHQHTEMGYPTTTTSSGISEADQASYLVRWQLIANGIDRLRASHFYQIWDCGEDPTNVEHRFGLMRTNRAPKPSYVALAIMARKLMNTDYCGTVPAGDGITCQVYRRFDGSVVQVAWAFPQAAPAAIPTGAAQVRISDAFGNESTQATQQGVWRGQLDGSPRWIEGAARRVVDDALRQAVAERAKRLLQRLTLLPQGSRDASRTAIGTAAQEIDAALAQAAGPARDTRLRAALDALWAVPLDGARLMRDGHEELAIGLIGEECHHLTVLASRGLTGSDGGAAAQRALDEIERIAARVAQRCGPRGALTTTARILGKARLHADALRGEPTSRSFAGEAECAHRCAQFAAAFAEREAVFFPGTTANAIPKFFTVAPGGQGATAVEVTNGDDADIEVGLELRTPTAWKQQPQTLHRRLAPGAAWKEALPLVPPEGLPAGTMMANLVITKDGKPWRDLPLSITVGSPVSVRLEPSPTLPAGITALRVGVSNLFDQKLAGLVRVRLPDGSPVAEGPFTLDGKARTIVTLPARASDVPGHDIRFQGEVVDGAGKVLWRDELPLDLPFVRSVAVPPALDGTLRGFETASAVHLLFGAPAAREDASAQAWVVHDAANLYIAVKALDDVHSQPEAGSNMWKGDCLQIGVDPTAARSDGAYSPQDWELGVSLSDGRQVQTTVWVGRDQAVMRDARIAIVRDDAARTTTYTFSLPLKSLGIPLKAGQAFGLNLGLNDADRTFGRANTIQVTSGICDAKNPAAWYRWVLE